MELTSLHVWRNVTKLGYIALESVLITEPMVDAMVVCYDPKSDDETELLSKRIAERFPEKVRLVEFVWPKMTDGSAIGIASQYALNHVPTSHVVNIQADEAWCPELVSAVKEHWREWVSDGYEAFRFKVLNTEHNVQQFQGGGNWEWQNGAGYNHSYKMIKRCNNTKFFPDAWSFDFKGFVVADVKFSEQHPIVHCHDMFRDHLIALRRNAADELWTDPEKFGHYRASADEIEQKRDEWFNDPKWTRTESQFDSVLHPLVRDLLGQTSYRVRWELLK